MNVNPNVLKFIFAVLIVGVVIEITDHINHTAAYTMVAILILGILLDNPLALNLINVSGNSLGSATK